MNKITAWTNSTLLSCIFLLALAFIPSKLLAQTDSFTALIHVNTVFDDGAGENADITVVCNAGYPLVQQPIVRPDHGLHIAVHELWDGAGTVCAVQEFPRIEGYNLTYSTNGVATSDQCWFERGEGSLGESNRCEITHTPIPGYFLDCGGFNFPMDEYPVISEKSNVVYPLAIELFNDEGIAVTDLDLESSPIIQVVHSSTHGVYLSDITEYVLSAGHATKGDQFSYSKTGLWEYGLKSENYTSKGRYIVTIQSGDTDAYGMKGNCSTSFEVR